MVEDILYLHLHKLSAIKSEEAIDHILATLWKTRKTGLSSSEKSHFQSLLNLPSLSQLDPVLACLRSLIRKCAYQNFTGDDLLKLFPPDLPLDLQSILVLSFQKNKHEWKEDMSSEQHLLPSTSGSYQVRTNVSPSLTSFPSSEMPTFQWPRQDDPLARLNHNDFGIPMPLVAEISGSGLNAYFQPDIASSDNLENLPRLKSMTWTMENHGTSPGDKVAIISLKLHDHSKSPFGETEVKFKVSRDTLEAMLRSLTYISGQLSSVENLPHLKSMTMENHGTSPGDKVAIISLKLHDHSKSPFRETEVKFKVSRDTLEAMLRSLTYISGQLSSVGGTSSRSANKKQKQ